MEPNNKALWAALKSCQDAFEADKKQRFEKAAKERALEQERLKRKEEIKKEILKEKEEVAQEDDLLSSFLTEVASSSKNKDFKPSETKQDQIESKDNNDDELASFFSEVAQPRPVVSSTVVSESHHKSTDNHENHQDGDEEEKMLTEKYVNQNLGDGKSQCERLLASHHEWKNLNPYYVLQLDNDATVEDIKFRYKKLSLKVHPDRNRDIENARQAFEYVSSKAYC